MRTKAIGKTGFSSIRCAALFVSIAAFTSFGASLAGAQANIFCNGQQNTSSSLPFTASCSGTTPQGASFSASGDTSFVPGGIAFGSKVSETGPSPLAGVLDNVHLSGTVVSDHAPAGTPLVLETWVSGSATDPAVPWGGTYTFTFQCDTNFCGSTQLQIQHWTAVDVNNTVVIPSDASERSSFFVICNPPFIAGEGCDKSAPSGSGGITIAPRTGTYQTTVGSSISFDLRFGNGFNYGAPTAGAFSDNFDPPGLGFAAVNPTTGAPVPGTSLVLSDGTVIPLSSSASYSCIGFQSPFDVALSLPKKANRAIPLKAQLFDSQNNPITPATLGSATYPVVNISYQSNTSPAVDDTSLLAPLGSSSSGNQFNFDSATGTWWFNLSTSPFTASGTYTVTMRSGDATRYQVSPVCSGTFVRP
jgi:hypothetical protein